MTLSFVLCKRLAALMNFGNLKQRRTRLLKLELLIQAILVFHFVLGFDLHAHLPYGWRVLVEATYYILSELVPFVAVVIAFFYQLSIYRDELQAEGPTSADTGSTDTPTDDEFRRYFCEA